MRAVVQRVKSSSVSVNDEIVGSIGPGLNVLLGIGTDDDEKMNLSLLDTHGEILVISQFTLQGDCRKGRRPSFIEAARPKQALELYKKFVEYIENKYDLSVETGTFQEHMAVDIQNDGPVTLLVDSKKEF